jgi:hypothetical protein
VISERSSSAPRDEGPVEHPDGWYWIDPTGRREFGPYRTRAEALAHASPDDDEVPAEGETLAEAESELGLADWIDPETGEPGMGRGRPDHDDR